MSVPIFALNMCELEVVLSSMEKIVHFIPLFLYFKKNKTCVVKSDRAYHIEILFILLLCFVTLLVYS